MMDLLYVCICRLSKTTRRVYWEKVQSRSRSRYCTLIDWDIFVKPPLPPLNPPRSKKTNKQIDWLTNVPYRTEP